MQETTIEYKGIARNISNQEIQDGWLDELINARRKNGILGPIGTPAKLYNLPAGTFLEIWHHDQDNVSNYIGLEAVTFDLKVIDMELGSSTLIKSYSAIVDVEFIKRFMVVVHADGIDRLIYQDDSYSLITFPGNALVTYSLSESKIAVSDIFRLGDDNELDAKTLLGNYFKEINKQSNDNFHTGGIVLRTAFKMFDGSYVLHSAPFFVELGLALSFYRMGDTVSWSIPVAKLNISFHPDYFTNINSEIFTNLVVFACKNEELYELTEQIIEDDILPVYKLGPSTDLKDYDTIEVSADFKNMADSPSWYKIHEVSLTDIQNKVSLFTEEIDIKGFYQDYATRETLPVDQFSHHELTCEYAYNYISRLIAVGVSTIFGNYSYFPLNPANLGATDGAMFPSGYTYTKNYPVKMIVTLSSDGGTIIKIVDLGSRPFASKSGDLFGRYMVLGMNIIGYPDTRATKIELVVDRDENDIWYKFKEFTLKKSLYGNFAYYHNNNFNVDHSDYEYNYSFIFAGSPFPLLINPINLGSFTNTVLKNSNRVQISEVNNPFYYPAENSYEVGTGKALAVATNTEPLSSGQFGEHPLIVFTSKGRFAMYQGQGDVLFSSVKPLDGDVPENTKLITSVAGGVVFSTSEGLYYAVGNQLSELSTALYGAPNLDLKTIDNFTLRVNRLNLVQLLSNISNVDAKLYVSGAVIGFKKKFNELVVTNDNYNYSYVYSFKSAQWHKISESYELFINSYPRLLAVRSNTAETGVFDLNNEQEVSSIATLVVTRPMKINNRVDFVLIHRAIQRCEIETAASTYAGFYVFGSNDMKTWQLFQGTDRKTGEITDLFCTRSHLKCKYFVFVFAADLKSGGAINSVNIQYYLKLTNKIR